MIYSLSPVFLSAKNCTFTNNRHGVFSFIGNADCHIVFDDCHFACAYDANWHDPDAGDDILSIQQSHLSISHSTFKISAGAFVFISAADQSHITISNTTFDGYVGLAVSTESKLNISNCSMTKHHSVAYKVNAEGQIIVRVSSVFIMTGTTINWTPIQLIQSDRNSSVTISDCLLHLETVHKQIVGESSFIAISRTTIFWFAHPAATRASAFLLVHSRTSEILLDNVNLTALKLNNETYSLIFDSSNVTVTNCNLVSVQISYLNGSNNYLSIYGDQSSARGLCIKQ